MNFQNNSMIMEIEFMPSREKQNDVAFMSNLESHLSDFFQFLSIEVETIEVNNTSGEEIKTVSKPEYEIHIESNGSPRLKIDNKQILVRGDPFQPQAGMLENEKRRRLQEEEPNQQTGYTEAESTNSDQKQDLGGLFDGPNTFMTNLVELGMSFINAKEK